MHARVPTLTARHFTLPIPFMAHSAKSLSHLRDIFSIYLSPTHPRSFDLSPPKSTSLPPSHTTIRVMIQSVPLPKSTPKDIHLILPPNTGGGASHGYPYGKPPDHILPVHHHNTHHVDYSAAHSLLVSDATVPVPLGSCETHLGCSATLTSW